MSLVRRHLSIVASVVFALACCACAAPAAVSGTLAVGTSAGATASAAPSPEPVHLINPMGPTAIAVAGIDSGAVSAGVSVRVSYWKTTDEAIGLLAADDTEFAVLPVTAAVNIYASGVDIVMLAVHEWRAFYLVAAGDNAFDGWDSLIGKTIYTPEAKGQTVDVLTRYALAANGIEPDVDVAFVYSPAQEIVALFGEGMVEYAALPEPYVTQALAAGQGRVVLDYQDYWADVADCEHGIPIAGLFVTRAFLDEQPGQARQVAGMLSDSTAWANDEPEAAIEASSAALPLPADVVREALTRLGFEYVPAAEVKDEVLRFLTVVRATYPESVKAVPDDAFFAGP